MRKLFFLFISLLGITSVFSQGGAHVVSLKTKQKFPIKGFYISEVIDQRVVRQNIGILPLTDLHGNTYGWVPAVFPSPFETYLHDILGELIKHKREEAIVLIVHEFYLSEIYETWSKYGRFRFRFEFAKRKGDRLYSLFQSKGSVKGEGSNITKGHPSSIHFGLQKAFTDFHNSNWKKKEGGVIELDEKVGLDIKKAPKRGLYHDFVRLASNEPFRETGYKLNQIKDTYGYTLTDSLGKRIKKNVLFVSDGKDIYMSALHINGFDESLLKPLFVGKYLYFEARFSDPSASVAFGAVGAITTNSSKAIVLDSETGLVDILGKQRTVRFLKQYPDQLKTYLSSERKLEDRREAILSINELYKQRP